MGLALEFHQGDAQALFAAFTNCDYNRLDDPKVVKRTADFSLHITPKDLTRISHNPNARRAN
ncbi:MAG TPA: hypothetical protein PLP42_17625 [Acidobacteriota bacterium]|nr:hypothetical protein [Acidobacteriota bacterium]